MYKKYKNKRIESDYAQLRRFLITGKGFKRMHYAKANLEGIEKSYGLSNAITFEIYCQASKVRLGL